MSKRTAALGLAVVAATSSACSTAGLGAPAPTVTITVTATPTPSSSQLTSSAKPANPRWDVPRAQDTAAELLGALVVDDDRAGGYSRAAFGQRWSDDTNAQGAHSGCDTRNDVLRRDLRAVETKPGTHGCVVLSGTLKDPYSGATVPFARGVATSSAVQVDHVVSVGDAWQSGANRWTAEDRATFANDPLNLVAVSGEANVSKGNQNAAEWLPPAGTQHCGYVARQIAVKARWRLSISGAERAAMVGVLAKCPKQLALTGPWRVPTSAGPS